jgi:hypothetical protein
MNEQELRAMVRESIARRLGAAAAGDAFGSNDTVRLKTDTAYATHASFVRLPLASGGDDDGACLIEPAVRCTHCGYCQSYGH